MPKPIGCDQWTGQMPGGYCDRYVPDSMFEDEVTDEVFCPQHAGPLSALGGAEGREGSDSSNPWRWSARQVDLYSLALKVAGKVDRPIPVPVQLGIQAGAA